MINATSTTSDLPNLETMYVVGQATPEIFISLSVFRDELTVEQQDVYDTAIAVAAANNYNQITNTVAELEISRITSLVLTEGTVVQDFATMDVADQDKLRDLLALFIELNV